MLNVNIIRQFELNVMLLFEDFDKFLIKVYFSIKFILIDFEEFRNTTFLGKEHWKIISKI